MNFTHYPFLVLAHSGVLRTNYTEIIGEFIDDTWFLTVLPIWGLALNYSLAYIAHRPNLTSRIRTNLGYSTTQAVSGTEASKGMIRVMLHSSNSRLSMKTLRSYCLITDISTKLSSGFSLGQLAGGRASPWNDWRTAAIGSGKRQSGMT